MKNFLRKKWVGPLVLFLYALAISLFLSHQITPYFRNIAPVIVNDSADFLPIVVQNGEIVQPVGRVIHKAYKIEGGIFNFVLDTRTDTLDINKLSSEGLYVSKKCAYFISPDESKMQCFDSAQTQQPLVITEDDVKELIGTIDKYLDVFLNGFLVVILFVVFYLAILFYTILIHWIIALSFKKSFGQTLYINTLAYVILGLLEEIADINIGILIRIILFICINLVICKNTKENS